MHNGTDCIAFRRSVAGGTGLAKSLFAKPHYIDRRNDDPEQFVAIGWGTVCIQSSSNSLAVNSRGDKDL